MISSLSTSRLVLYFIILSFICLHYATLPEGTKNTQPLQLIDALGCVQASSWHNWTHALEIHDPWPLTHLTWLIHTSVLPSNWNPGKIFVLTVWLGQVHTVKKIFLIFLHAGRWLFLLLNLWFSSKLVSKMN